jgi:hypothetical protein
MFFYTDHFHKAVQLWLQVIIVFYSDRFKEDVHLGAAGDHRLLL